MLAFRQTRWRKAMKLFDTTILLVLTLSLMIGAIATALASAAGASYPAALITGGVAAWAVITGLPRLMK
jgi:hypothetical protein